MSSCSMEHRILHDEVKNLLRRTDMSSVSVENMMDKLEELVMEATFDSRETSILAMFVHMKNMVKEFTYRRREGTITVEETAELCEAILRRFTDSRRNLFTDDLCFESASSCKLSRAITSVLKEMKSTIEQNHYYRNYSGKFEDHVGQIRSGNFDLRTYKVIIALHNIHVSIFETLNDRLDCLRQFDGSIPSLDASPKDEFHLHLFWNTSQDSFMLREVKEGAAGQSTIFHSSFLKIVRQPSAEIWRNRRKLGAVNLSVAHTCAVCLREDVSTSKLTVLSGCTHVFCTPCIETWFDRNRNLSCPCCRTISDERIMAVGYGNLLRMIR